MKYHKLKIEMEHLKDIVIGVKTCEIRKNDRDYQVGDYIFFENKGCDFPLSYYLITHVLRFPKGLKKNYVALSIKPIR